MPWSLSEVGPVLSAIWQHIVTTVSLRNYRSSAVEYQLDGTKGNTGVTWELAANVATALGGAIAILGAPFAYLTYLQSVRTRRAEWLSSLHESFFESERYRQIRRVLDYKPESEYNQLVQAVANGTHSPLIDEFYRYLNFFELLSSLRGLGEISDDEIIALFEYDLRMLKEHDFIISDLPDQGFERLSKLLGNKRLLSPR